MSLLKAHGNCGKFCVPAHLSISLAYSGMWGSRLLCAFLGGILENAIEKAAEKALIESRVKIGNTSSIAVLAT